MPTRVVPYEPGIARVQAQAGHTKERAAELIADDMRRYVPVDEGDLRDTIRTDHGAVVSRIWIGDVAGGVDYHLYQEFGTSKMSAQPYIRPAVYQYRGSL